MLLLGKCWLILLHGGTAVGFDIGAHQEMLDLVSWSDPHTDIHGSFYGYHPPLGFLLPYTFTLAGLETVKSIQLISLLSALLAFFCWRGMFKLLGLLKRPAAILFLYLSASVPLYVHMSVSLNLDIIILALASLTMLCCVYVYWLTPRQKKTVPTQLQASDFTWQLTIVAIMVLAMYVKFSGVLLFTIPVLTVLANPQKQDWRRNLSSALIITCTAVLLMLPYYVTRYYQPAGTLFPNNGDWFNAAAMDASREQRDADPLAFFQGLITPTDVHATEGYRFRDYDVVRLSDTWRDFWVKDQFLGNTIAPAETMGMLYVFLMPWLLLLGGIAFVSQLDQRDAWIRCGWLVLAFVTVNFVLFIAYIYKTPLPAWGPSKGIYIVSVTWLIGYLLAHVLTLHQTLVKKQHPLHLPLDWLAVFATGAFVGINHAIPVYF